MKTIEEKNRLIAEFMGYEPIKKMLPTPDKYGNLFTKEFTVFQIEPIRDDGIINFHIDFELKFHTSWDWLMPVVDKIEQTIGGVPQELLHLSLFSEHIEVYNAVVQFIEWYNEQK